MNQEVLDYISQCSDTVPREPWTIDDIFRHAARGGQQILVFGGSRWRDRMRGDVDRRFRSDSVLHTTIRSSSPASMVLHDGTVINFFTGESSYSIRGFHWNVAFLEQFMVDVTSAPGMMPVWRIPPQPDWRDVNDAVEDALEFLATRNGEVEFDFQGNRYKVPYGCDYAVLVGSLIPESPYWFSFGNWHNGPVSSPTAADTYGGISRSEALRAQPQLSLDDLVTNITAQRFADWYMRPSPTFERLRSRNPESMSGGIEVRHPIRFALPDPPPGAVGQTLYWSPPGGDPLEFPMPGPGTAFSEAAWNSIDLSMPRARLAYHEDSHWSQPTAREHELLRRLETIRECLTRTPSPLVFDTPETAQRMMHALAFDGQPVDESRVLLVSDPALKYGTILDAATRPMRKFRLVEE